jgi:phosphoglycolate phosphatase-like HAD superfamily hydrolase
MIFTGRPSSAKRSGCTAQGWHTGGPCPQGLQYWMTRWGIEMDKTKNALRTLVIFDVDGTLIHSGLESDCYVAALSEHLGVDTISADWASYRHASDPGIAIETYERLTGREPTIDELRAFHNRFVAHLKAAIALGNGGIPEIPGASMILHRLRQDDRFLVAIATGAWREPIHIKLSAAKVDISGLPMASADDAIERATIFALAANRVPEPFGKVILIGDGIWDAITARKLGFAFLGIGAGSQATRLRSEGALHVVEDFLAQDDVLDLLLNTP